MCGLQLAVPAASELLAASTRVYEAERGRQAVIARMRSDQAAAFEAAGAAAWWSTAPARPPVPAAAAPAAPVAGAAPVATTAAPVAAPAGGGAPGAPPTVAAGPPAPRRSGVQVLLLALGVVLLSVAAIVFLFVAYLVASLEVRSIIIASASVLVLALAWFLRARRLPGTAEGVASVAVVLLLLDVYTVRANDVFGTGSLRVSTYWGAALLVVAGLLAASRLVSGVRVPGFAAAGITPVALFLLAAGLVSESDVPTGVWLGFLAAATAGLAALFVRPRVERTVVLIESGAAGALAFLTAIWALPDITWSATWAFGAVAVVWLLAVAALRLPTARLHPAWSQVAAVIAGASAALAPTLGVAGELEAADAVWIAPAAATAVACVLAAFTLRRGIHADARNAFLPAAAVAVLASVPGIQLGVTAIAGLLFKRFLVWAVPGDANVSTTSFDSEPGVVLTPIVMAIGAAIALSFLRRLRTLMALPLGFALFTVVAASGIASTISVAVLILLALATGALAVAATPVSRRLRGSIPTLAAAGMTAAAMTWAIAHASTDIWWWAVTAVLLLSVAGRVLAARVWSAASAGVFGILHLVVTTTVFAITMATLPGWADAAHHPFPAPWDSPWMCAGTACALVLGGLAFAPRLARGDRAALVAPPFAAALIAATALVVVPTPTLAWVPAMVLAIAAGLWLRPSVPVEPRVAFGAATPLALGLGTAGLAHQFAGAPVVALGLAGAALVGAGLAHVVRRLGAATTAAWSAAVGFVAVVALGVGVGVGPVYAAEPWLVLLVLTPVPVILAGVSGDPIGGDSPLRHLSWLSLALAVATVWTWLAGDAVTDVEAYSLPLAAALAIAGALITWRRTAAASTAAGRTTLFASAAAVAVLPSVASSAGSELRTLVLVSIGAVVVIAGQFLPERSRGVPIRLLAVVAGWTAVTGAALVRGTAVAAGEPSALIPEFWPFIGFATGVFGAIAWAWTGSRPAMLAEWMLAASLVLGTVPTVVAIAYDDQPTLRAAVLLPALAAVHIANASLSRRPFAGAVLGWSSLGALVAWSVLVLVLGTVDPFDVTTIPLAAALIGAGALRMRRSPALGSWPALGPGLAVLLIPWLVADWTDSELWRIVTLGIVSVAAVVAGAVWRLEAPLLLGAAVLLVHALNSSGRGSRGCTRPSGGGSGSRSPVRCSSRSRQRTNGNSASPGASCARSQPCADAGASRIAGRRVLR
ncbi:hypothetical protein EDM22_07075 [Agromyces tardus]|uniref:Uncharacterized protein n=1 Tax=Agromyces tardus TaxID=2583849 RepID=A0A3M8AH20_9MICO|nr:hypothetical protein EDM22_07075 [Agromyces tardus]